MNRDIRVAGWAGIAAFATGALVVFLTGTPTQPYPDWSWTDQQIAHHFAVQRTNVAAQFYLANFGFALVVWFAAGLKHLLHTATGPSVHLSLIIPCAAVQAVTLQQTNGMWWVAALRPTVDAHNARLAYEICIAVGYTAIHFFMSFMIFATATQLRRGTVFPRFWATTSYVAAAIVMCGTF
ncbi:hypothetical protein, partial [Streptomyces sp. NPDC089915]|uniref:hypothetical protein n=1 Tax=Streptomyces sp. NPDC089915 TaxID=3155186 RepID=UPI00342DFBE7